MNAPIEPASRGGAYNKVAVFTEQQPTNLHIGVREIKSKYISGQSNKIYIYKLDSFQPFDSNENFVVKFAQATESLWVCPFD